jgi:large subunit ribosomal protein L29
MANTAELRSLSDLELSQRLTEAQQELLNLRFRQATKQLDNTGRIRTVRRELARINTIMRQRELA